MSTRSLSVRMRASVAFISIVSLVAGPFAAIPAGTALAAGNSIANASFETGTGNTATNWAPESSTLVPANPSALTISTVAADVHSGTRAAKAEITSWTGGDVKWLPDATTTSAGKYYIYSEWYKSSTTTQVGYFANDGFHWLKDLPPTATWTQYQTDILIPAGITSIQMAHILFSVGTLNTDDYSLVEQGAPVFAHGMVTLSFDDGWKTFSDNAFPILASSSMKSTAYIISKGNVQDPTDYMTDAQIKSLAWSGLVEIGAHTRTHADLVNDAASSSVVATYSPATAAGFWQSEINDSRTDLQTLLPTSTIDTFAYPYGQYNAQVEGLVQGAGFIGARSVDDGFNLVSTDKYALKQKHITNTTTFADAKVWIDSAISNKSWVILMFHDVWPTIGQCVDREHPDVVDLDCTTTGVLHEIVNYLKTLPAGTVVTTHEGIGVMNSTPVADITPPVITAPSSMNVVATSSTSVGAVVTFTATAADTNPVAPVVTCTPASGSTFALGNTTVTCVANDAANNFATSTFVVNVTAPAAPNNAPTGTTQPVSLSKNGTATITLTGSDADAGDTLVFATSSNPAHGSLSGTAPSLSYAPTTDYVGSDFFIYTVGDGKATTTATTTITVNDVVVVTPPSNGSGGCGSSCGGGGGPVGLIGQVYVNPSTGGGLVLGASTQVLTDAQIKAILDLLKSFNADQAVIDNVSKALHGQATSGTGATTGFVFTKTLQLGSKGTDVTELQKRLTAEGVYSGPVTGVFGPLTKAGVIAYQKKHSLDAVGVVGPKTRTVLNGK